MEPLEWLALAAAVAAGNWLSGALKLRRKTTTPAKKPPRNR